jgi:hypothetical protein|tara:strand:+ start:378 stop:968 length:591 start_codon:yes stop_codon:yes gene_type:complete
MADRPDLNLSGDAISSTFRHLLQVREDDKTLYDALGNVLDDFRLSGSFTTSEFLEIEDGQGVSGNKLHSRSGVLYWGNKNLETDEIPLLVDSTPQLGGNLDLNSKDIGGTGNFLIQGTGSLQQLNVGDNSFSSYLSVSPTNVEKDLFLVKSGSFSAFEVNDKGVMNLGGFTDEPDVVEGGFYYNTDENEFYLGTGE